MSERLELRASDGTRLSAVLDAPARGGRAGIVLLPGFWRRADSARIRWLALELARRWPVVTLDFRGHGESSGAFTFGEREHLDVEAALHAARERGLERVALVGMSMGAAAIPATLGSDWTPPVEIASALLIAAPSDFGAIRPRPWRGRRDVAWGDMLAVPRIDWRFPFTDKRRPKDAYARFPEVPVRFLHARHDWLVDHALGESLHAANPSRGEFFLLDTPGLHADELLGRQRDIVMRLSRAFLEASLAPPEASAGCGDAVDAAPWRAALAAHLADVRAHAPDLGGVPLDGAIGEVAAFSSGRDGVHLVARVGESVAWARGLRDGSVHGLNLLSNALAADAPAWPPSLRSALENSARHCFPAGAVRKLRRRGESGFEITP